MSAMRISRRRLEATAEIRTIILQLQMLPMSYREIAASCGSSVWMIERVARGDTIGLQARSIRKILPKLQQEIERRTHEPDCD